MNTQLERVITNNNLAQVCINSGITPYINGNPSQLGLTPPKTRAATIEAILGAVFLDSHDLNIVRQVMRAIGL